MLTFSRITLATWRQFDEVDLDLEAPLIVLTGPNGCGKTTILNILGRHFGWNVNLVSTPFLSDRERRKVWSEFGREWINDLQAAAQKQIGTIRYSSGDECTLHVPAKASQNPHYQLQYSNQQAVRGLNIPSHQPVVNYQRVADIPTDPKAAQQHYQAFQTLLLQSYVADKVHNPALSLKKSLIALATFGPGNDTVAPNPEYVEILTGFEAALRRVLPADLGFLRIEIRMPDVVLVTESGTFALDAMSGGVSALFMTAWQIQLFASTSSGPCTVVLDEPENHLHPSMQRTLLPSLRDAFPDHKFIVATHSPFIVSSDPSASVYGLTFGQNRRISSHRLSEADLSGSPSRILRDVLDVPTTIPVWVEREVRRVLAKHSDEVDPVVRADKIFENLRDLGLNAAIGDTAFGDD